MNRNLVYDFAMKQPRTSLSQIGQNIGQGIGTLVAGQKQKQMQQQAQQLRMQQEQARQQALQAYTSNPTAENAMAFMEASRPLGEAEGAQNTLTAFDKKRAENQVTQLGNLYGYALSGNTDLLLKDAERLRDAYANSENPEEQADAKQLQFLIDQFENGDIDITKVQAALMNELGQTEEGRKYVENIHKVNADRRADKEYQLKLLDTMVKTTFDNEQQRSSAWEILEGLGHQDTQAMLPLTQLLVEEGPEALSEEEKMTFSDKYRNEVRNITEPGRAASDAVMKINVAMEELARLEELDLELPPEGVLDIALMNFLQRGIIDQGVSVRSADVELLTGSAGTVQELINFLGGITAGTKLGEKQREVIKRLAEGVEEAMWKSLKKEMRTTYNAVYSGIGSRFIQTTFPMEDFKSHLYANTPNIGKKEGFDALFMDDIELIEKYPEAMKTYPNFWNIYEQAVEFDEGLADRAPELWNEYLENLED